MKKSVLLLTLSILTSSVFSQQAIVPEEIKNHITSRVNQSINPSIALAYIDGDEVSYFNTGKTETKLGNEINEHTVYEIGSISKVFTTILLAEEIVKGNMKLSDPISKYLPETIKLPKQGDKEVTIEHLATHTSALPRMPNNFSPKDYNNPYADYTKELLYEFLNNCDLTRDIGSKYEYSNLGMGLLGHILELHTGKSFESLVIERITKPLEMNSTRVVFTENMKQNLALGHNEQFEVVSNWDIPVLSGAGALRSTSSDMVKFLKANLKTDETTLNKAMKLSQKLMYTDSATKVNIGLGWHFENNNTIIWHKGGTGGYKTFVGILKDSNKGVVVLSNSTNSIDQIGFKMLGAPLELQLPKLRKFPDVVIVPNNTLASYVGVYQLTPEFKITISKEKSQLHLQATGQPKFKVFPSSQKDFFLKVVEASITFNENSEGKVESLVLHQNGRDLPAQKIE